MLALVSAIVSAGCASAGRYVRVGADASVVERSNVDASGLALEGFDPVAYVVDGKAVRGRPEVWTRLGEVEYWFANAEHRAAFERDPEAYRPAFGGFCAYALADGSIVHGDPEVWQIQHGRVVLQNNGFAKWLYNQDADAKFVAASGRWEKLRTPQASEDRQQRDNAGDTGR